MTERRYSLSLTMQEWNAIEQVIANGERASHKHQKRAEVARACHITPLVLRAEQLEPVAQR